ncbi:MAG: hypothetical protein NUV69_00810 [Candidatus Curtissbacteria bacterium]|nr:hypothetical protein [Candidatus Colwellbacteria bacterium]MCR4324211.1 hypothetical protein [Candidatus Curtissbacteria bacterium]
MTLSFIKPKLIALILLIAIIAIGIYLRFYNYENEFRFGWDQSRDAWIVRDILEGQPVLKGPRVGVGDFYLGPAYFYLLAALSGFFFHIHFTTVFLPIIYLPAFFFIKTKKGPKTITSLAPAFRNLVYPNTVKRSESFL